MNDAERLRQLMRRLPPLPAAPPPFPTEPPLPVALADLSPWWIETP